MIPRGIRNKNPFNIKKSNQSWKGKIYHQTTDDVFEQFVDIVYGIRSGLIILRTYINEYKLDTIERIIKRFAPSSENNVDAYIKSVYKSTGFNKDYVIKFDIKDILPLTIAICKHENGGNYITNEQVEEAWRII